MRVIIRAEGVNLWLPIPLGLVGFAISMIPNSAIQKIQTTMPAINGQTVVFTKALLQELYRDCRSTLHECRGLEIVHVETHDGTFVSIKL